MRVDNQVKSHAQWPSSANLAGHVRYEFERLPSQSQPPAATTQAELEGLAAAALARSGWHAAPPPVAWRVQVSARTDTLPRAPWEDPRDAMAPRLALGVHGGGAGLRLQGLRWAEQPYHVRTVTVVVRDAAEGRVAFESSALHEGRWNDTPALWQAMMDAALAGFPHSPAGPRQIDVDIPR
jgi:hypothetical protein